MIIDKQYIMFNFTTLKKTLIKKNLKNKQKKKINHNNTITYINFYNHNMVNKIILYKKIFCKIKWWYIVV